MSFSSPRVLTTDYQADLPDNTILEPISGKSATCTITVRRHSVPGVTRSPLMTQLSGAWMAVARVFVRIHITESSRNDTKPPCQRLQHNPRCSHLHRRQSTMTMHRPGRRWLLRPIVTADGVRGESASLLHPQPGTGRWRRLVTAEDREPLALRRAVHVPQGRIVEPRVGKDMVVVASHRNRAVRRHRLKTARCRASSRSPHKASYKVSPTAMLSV